MDKLIKNGKERIQSWRHKLATPIVVFLLCLATYYVVFSANGLMVYEKKRHESQDLDKQIKALQQQNGSMEQEVKALKSDPQTIEKEAREHLRYSRPGEVVFTIPTVPAVPARDKK